MLHIFVQIIHCASGWAAGGDSGKAVVPCVPSHVIWCGCVSSQRKGHSLLFSTKVPYGLTSGLDCHYDLLFVEQQADMVRSGVLEVGRFLDNLNYLRLLLGLFNLKNSKF